MIFSCWDPEESFIRSMVALSEAEFQADEVERDKETEFELGRAEVLEEAECPWPFYADEPREIEKREIIPAWVGRP